MKQSHNKENTCKRNNNLPSLIPPSASVDGKRGRRQNRLNKMKLHEKQPKTQQPNETKPKQSQNMQKKQQPTFIDSSICLCGWKRWRRRNRLNKVKLHEKQPKRQQSNTTKPKQRQHMQKKQQPTIIDSSIHLCGCMRWKKRRCWKECQFALEDVIMTLA